MVIVRYCVRIIGTGNTGCSLLPLMIITALYNCEWISKVSRGQIEIHPGWFSLKFYAKTPVPPTATSLDQFSLLMTGCQTCKKNLNECFLHLEQLSIKTRNHICSNSLILNHTYITLSFKFIHTLTMIHIIITHFFAASKDISVSSHTLSHVAIHPEMRQSGDF